MTPGVRRTCERTFLTAVLIAAGATATARAQARPVLERADVAVAYESPSACTVEVTPTVRDAAVVRHQLVLVDGVVIEGVSVGGGAALLGTPARVPRGAGMIIEATVTAPAPGAPVAYRLSYRATGIPRHQCPIAVPDTPSTGLPGRVQLRVTLPAGEALPVSGFPSIAWMDGGGRASLGHVPAFVLAPFGAAAAGLTLARTMDTVALTVLIVASAIWYWNRHRGRRHA